MERLKQKARTWAPALLAVVLTCFYPCIFIYSQNAGEARAMDMLPFLGLFLFTAGVIFLMLGLVFRDVGRSAFVTCLAMLVVINFSLVAEWVKTLLPWFYAKYQLVLVAAVGLGLIALLAKKKPNMQIVCILIALMFGAMSLVSFFTAIPKLIATATESSQVQDVSITEVIETDKPNVYYLLFDEYGGDENLKTYFGYDNSDFYTQLTDRGFSVSHSTYNAESCWTDTLVPNLLNLDYVADDSMTEKARREYLEKPYLAELLQENGYSVNLINHRAYLRVEGARELTQNQMEDNISEYLLENSLFSKIDYFDTMINRRIFVSYRDNYLGPLNNCFQQLQNCWQEAKSGPTLTMSYIQSPHAPFVFNADGTVRDLTTGWYWRDETLYPGQLQYVNSRILEAVDNIQKNDPNAVILLMSDHGARVPLHMVEQFGGPRFDAEKETHVMQNALCCVYVPGQVLDIEGQTGINATRMALNAAFGMNLELVTPKTGYILPEIYNAKEDKAPDSPESVFPGFGSEFRNYSGPNPGPSH